VATENDKSLLQWSWTNVSFRCSPLFSVFAGLVELLNLTVDKSLM
jgi:hypothetical protein